MTTRLSIGQKKRGNNLFNSFFSFFFLKNRTLQSLFNLISSSQLSSLFILIEKVWHWRIPSRVSQWTWNLSKEIHFWFNDWFWRYKVKMSMMKKKPFNSIITSFFTFYSLKKYSLESNWCVVEENWFYYWMAIINFWKFWRHKISIKKKWKLFFISSWTRNENRF